MPSATKPKLIKQTAARISGADVEAILGFTLDKRRAFWLRDGTVYVYPWALGWAGFVGYPRSILISYEENEEIWEAHANPRIRRSIEECRLRGIDVSDVVRA